MATFITFLLIWLGISLPVGLVLGRMLRRAADEQSEIAPVSAVQDYGYRNASVRPVYARSNQASAYARTALED